ncbi:hypothetical protein JTB14_007790 [Gonioctena quinquepunctata]|nr:hypothetical protein JTB14_007790 [Gonioctena quinquepunctata]
MKLQLMCLLGHAVQLVFPIVSAENYVVPKPQIRLLHPKGFRVSIPDTEGIELFAFHGNINKPMEGLEAGQFSKDILKKRKNEWVFKDRRTQLKDGDVIYYWLFVIKDRLGYRYDDGQFHVKDSSDPSQWFHPISSTVSSEIKPSDPRCQLLLNINEKVGDLESQIEKLQENSSILRKLIEKNEELSVELKFQGVLPPYEDASYSAQVIIDGKLGLKVPVNNATWDSDSSITFRVANLDEKVQIISAARKQLNRSKIKLIY